ncbi:unnamed protein product [Cylicostephanus goldi]|uniref:Uncharacterized protein n=1 Tax=Cylicostephanus goldi TaxID=71465 RepID=A0A3P6TBY5_CYLGO|nr:unnamed protein product [Cylicostephanus goldi]
MPKVDESIVDKALCAVDQYAYRLRHRLQNGPTVLDLQSTLTSTMPFPAKTIKATRTDAEVEAKLCELKFGVRRIYENEMIHYTPNITTFEKKGPQKLIRMTKVRYTIGDKSGSFVVMSLEMDKEVTCQAFSDS